MLFSNNANSNKKGCVSVSAVGVTVTVGVKKWGIKV